LAKPLTPSEYAASVIAIVLSAMLLCTRAVGLFLLRHLRRIVASAVIGVPLGLLISKLLDEYTPEIVTSQETLSFIAISCGLTWTFIATAAWRRHSPLATEIGLSTAEEQLFLGEAAVLQVIASLRMRARRLRLAAK